MVAMSKVDKYATADSKFGGNKTVDLKTGNIKKAMKWLFGHDLRAPCTRPFNMELSHKIHADISANGLIEGSGELWDSQRHGSPVSDGARHPYVSDEEVEQQLDELFCQCNDFIARRQSMSRDEKFCVAAYFIYRHLAIHPYSDGNGRVARLLTSLLLLRLGAVSEPLRFDLPRDSRRRYIEGLNQGPVSGPDCTKLAILRDLMMEADQKLRRRGGKILRLPLLLPKLLRRNSKSVSKAVSRWQKTRRGDGPRRRRL